MTSQVSANVSFTGSITAQALYGVSNTATTAYVPQDFSSSGLNIPAYVVSNTATVANTVAYSSFGPFAGEGSLYFPGGSAPVINFGGSIPQFTYDWTTADFTIEGNFYPTGSTHESDYRIFGKHANILLFIQASTRRWTFYINGITTPGGGVFVGPLVAYNEWSHVSVSWVTSTKVLNLSVNGSVTTFAAAVGTPTYTPTAVVGFGQWVGVTGAYTGYISNFRFTRGQALYTTSFTPPTGPLQPIQGVTQGGKPYGTVLLLRNAPAPGRVLTSKFGGANSGQVLSFPPAAMTSYSTALNAGYGQGTYVASASSDTNGAAWQGFDKTPSTLYSSSSNFYTTFNASSNIYTGTTTTTDVNGNSYLGEWLQLQAPSSVVLSTYQVQMRTDLAPGSGEPETWWILGSRDGTTWFLVDQRSNVSWSGAGAINTLTVQSSQAFTYFRFVTYIVGKGTSGGRNVAFAEWTLNGQIEGLALNPDGRVGLGVSNPTRALEVAGDVVCGGTVSSGNPFTFKNALYNGDMRISQRGTSFVNPSSAYTLDRWYASTYGATGTGTLSQIQSGLANFSNALQLATTSTTSGNWYITQSIETRDVVRFQGQMATLSFWWRLPTAFSERWRAYLVYGTGTDTKIVDINVPSTTVANADAFVPSSAWSYVQISGFIPSSALSMAVQFITYGNIVNGAQFQVTGVQLEKGSVATPFEVRPYATELALCQRYYEKSYDDITAPGTNADIGLCSGVAGDTAGLQGPVFKVTKRNPPTMIFWSKIGTVNNISGWTTTGTNTAQTNYGGVGQNSCRYISAAVTTGTIYTYHWTASAEL